MALLGSYERSARKTKAGATLLVGYAWLVGYDWLVSYVIDPPYVLV